MLLLDFEMLVHRFAMSWLVLTFFLSRVITHMVRGAFLVDRSCFFRGLQMSIWISGFLPADLWFLLPVERYDENHLFLLTMSPLHSQQYFPSETLFHDLQSLTIFLELLETMVFIVQRLLNANLLTVCEPWNLLITGMTNKHGFYFSRAIEEAEAFRLLHRWRWLREMQPEQNIDANSFSTRS